MDRSLCTTDKNTKKAGLLQFKHSPLFLVLVMVAQQLQAGAPTATSGVGDEVTNPATNQPETVSALIKSYGGEVISVLTTSSHYISVPVAQNQILRTSNGEHYKVTSVTLDAQNELSQYTVIQVTLNDQGQVASEIGSAMTVKGVEDGVPANGPGTPATSWSSANLPASGPIQIVNRGANGANGRAGGGFWIFSYSATDGDNGSAGATTNITVGSNHSLISTAGSYAAIEVASIGGNGGNGGDFIGALNSAGKGGQSGNGGNVTLVNDTDVSLGSGQTGKFGIYVYSQSGKGGNGGEGIGWADGGSGGGSTSSGTVDATNNGSVTTQADKAYGLYGLSAAGAAGSAGDSWGIVGKGGTGAAAGNGKKVTLINNGQINTGGTDAHGIFAQSIGGTGGASGDAGGLVAIGGKGGDGGKGGEVSVTNSGAIATTGTNARGIFAESIGGGGGTGGYASGAVSIGGKGGAGNDAGRVEVTNTGSINTLGDKATGIFAQSVGGGGGDGGSTGGLVTIGGDGTSGGQGGTVVVTQGGEINTEGDDAYGIFAQSVGGGGGNGGSSNSGSLFAGFALGGQGGEGGDGGSVTVNLNQYSVTNPLNTSQLIQIPSHVSTEKERSIGIFAQSVGGGGGNGGAAVQTTVGLGASVSVSIGGDGGKGGQGGEVALNGSGNVLTSGNNSTGILLQSVGGGGGNGSLSVSVAGQTGPAGVGIALALGGKASDAGTGGTVTTNYQGDISTKGDTSAGLVAQSIGGGGGNGGTAISGAVSFGVAASGALSVGLGGLGGAGGAGGIVNLTVNSGGSVSTEGVQSTGILAQSVGGGGGNGGMSISGALSGAGGASGAVTVGLGGKGAGGGSAGKVTANVTSDVTTLGSGSGAVIFQSVGGGGGNGGLSVSAAASGGGIAGGSVSVGVGGEGVNAGHGDTVSATYAGDVTTSGVNSVGILAQSVGGGGGNGGNSIAANLAGGGAGAAAVTVGLGGKAGGGGDGGNDVDLVAVTLNTSGTVTTNEENSTGIVAQSIGGGGGNGGYSVAATGALAGAGSAAVSVGLGGNGGNGGAGKAVSATVDSVVNTRSLNSGGVVAQSVGGGGGNGGFNVSGAIAGAGAGAASISVGLGGNGTLGGSAGQVTLTTQKAITTTGNNSTGFTAQSLGGGGGNGGFNVSGALSLGGAAASGISVGLGGKGAAGGTAGKVIATSNGAIKTEGENSTGFLAQSLGGGGGNGGFIVSATAAGGGIGSGAISVGLGGSAGGGNSADTVNATVNASVSTTKDRSAGVVAQSIGGGGGNGGFNVSGALGVGGLGTGAISVGLGGTGGSGGNAAKVTAVSDGVIKTSGKESVGFLAQSVGGGGGNGGFNVSGTVAGASQGAGAVSVGLGGAGGAGGNAGQVDARVTKSVTTEQDMSSAIVVQSIGGGGGNGSFNVTGTVAGSGIGAGSVGVGIGGTGAGGGYSLQAKSNVNADVTTSGVQSLGVLVQSLGGGGGNGGFNVSGTIAAAGAGSGGVSVGLGGTAGTGGSSGDGTSGYVVDSTYHGTLTTNGRNSAGIVAQSLGGGGGNGGFDISGVISLSTTGSGAAAVAIGGAGGVGGNAGDVINRVSAGSKVTTNGGNPNDADSRTSFYSTGILAQSIGGGGGNGGISVAGTVALAGTGSGALAVAVGGGAGTAGNAGSATNIVTADVETKANHADGILVQSLGGGGGNGGIAIAGSVTAAQSGSGAVGVGVGGAGGSGGEASFADNTVTGDVTTHGNSAKGIVTQSIGGGGGNGGVSISALLNITANGGGLGVGVGGSGGGGKNGALAKSDITGTVTTSGADSTGILTQSLGGGGGTGGLNISGVLAISSSNAGALAIGVGGSGGGGGDGKTVDSTYSGILRTNGGNSAGLVAQSIGGGGGAGGLNISGAISLSGTKGGAGAVSIGGSGGGGGAGGEVTNVVVSGSKITTNAGSVDDTANNTKQFDSIAVLAQSIGGGGGSGGISVGGAIALTSSGAGSLSVGLGGSGGSGGDAGNVTNTMTATVDTFGYKGTGIFVQSLGGGGGNGGIAVAGNISGSNTGSSGAIGIGIGGSGGDGGKAGEARNTVTGPVHTRGGSANGIVTQSIGGGGGNGGLSVAGVVSVALSGNGGSVGIGVGGSGGGGKDGNLAEAIIAGDITTEGIQSTGILTQSVGGGGGTGGLNVTGVFAATESKNGSMGIGVGGSGGNGGSGATVLSSYTGTLKTNGTNAAGVVAQSIGGGGGAGGLNVSGAISLSGAKSGATAVSVGGSGGGGGNGGNVTNYVIKGSSITTSVGSVDDKADNVKQFDSIGVLAQSVGGGGGSGGISVGGAITVNSQGAGSLAFGLGGSGGDGGYAGSVFNNVTAPVETYGYRGSGVIAQSLGGGGGTGGLAVAGGISATKQTSGVLAIGIGGKGGGGGNAGTVTNHVEGTVHTRGSFADGITSASIGGGGGNGGVSVAGSVAISLEGKGGTFGIGLGGFGGKGGNAGNVSSNINTTERLTSFLPLPYNRAFLPQIIIDGQSSTGVIAQSIGGGGGNGGVNVTGGIAVSKGSGGTVGFGLGGFGGDGGDGAQVNLSVDSDISIRGTRAQTDTSNTEERTWYEHYSEVATQTKHETFDPSSTGEEDQVWFKTLGDYFPKIWKSLTQNTGVADPFYSRVNGSDSSALLAQSIGGGGGNGGLNVTGGIGVSLGHGVTEVSTNIGIGGFGGGGGKADTVAVSYIGSVRLIDNSPPNSGVEEYWSANGLVAQSIGGGGGNGGIDVAAGLAFTNKGEKGEGINLGLGGYGGAGGDAGAVSLLANLFDSAVSKTIQANGNGRTAILAQSIGGGGGNGGINVSGGISSDSNITLGIGGNGGDAGLGSNVDVTSRATLFSNGNFGQGILAQSIGGGGGNGGMNISGAIAYAKRQETPLTIGVGVGGFGGDGAKSGSVTVRQTGNVTTAGNSNHGIAAQSIGGGGGNGAFNMTTELLLANTTNTPSKDYSIVVGVGGSAGTGADSSLSSVDAFGKIHTQGDAARGIVAQSIGGGGGLGGVNFNLLVAKGSSTPINLAIGGSGGSGGTAGAVHVRHAKIDKADDISTDGVGAHAIEATSVGGGGGDAGMNLNFAGSTATGGSEDGTNAVPIVFSLGGAGGVAGNGAKVDVSNTSDLTTKQAQSNGILAQSIGGGGGNGALNIAENYSGKNKKARSININVGGQPGDGGYAGNVSVAQTGTVNTKGVGIMAQSIGGGGGNASMDYSLAQSDGGKLKINVGRVGGTGGTAGNVDVSVAGDVTTAGDDAYGIAGQSIGNGGGNSAAVTVGLTLPADAVEDKKSTAGMAVSVGLDGGKGGKSGNVSITTLSDKSITTTGKNAFGILAQSIGGGGGNGGSATAAQYKTNSMAVAVGGEGGEGGTSGRVNVNSSSNIETHSIGILAQSIGGGGGNGGTSKIMALGIKKVSDANEGGVRFNVTVGGLGGTGAASDWVEVVNKGSIKTTSATAAPATDDVESGLHGVLAQSIGGGGGNGGMSYQILNYKPTKESAGGESPEDSSVLNFAIGGKGGIGGTAGDVVVKNTADVTTGTTRSMGIFAQSVGGGGGNGGMAMNLSYQSAGQNSLNFAMGGNGGSGNRAGSVNVFNALTDAAGKTTIKTTGASSHGILAMSVGGGGGNGGMSTILNAGSQAKDKTFYNVAVSVGGSGGQGGIGGRVNVNNASTIETYGSKSHGIAALSIGGGGGNGEKSILINAIKEQDKDAMINVSIGGMGGDGNISSDVTVTNTGFITTSGDKSYGIMAQSIGGGGGNGAMAFNVNQTLVDKDTYLSKKAPARVLANFAMGGFGGSGADSGDVTVNHSGGVINVLGNNSYGIFAQTVSGAGGTGSYSIGNPAMSAVDYTLTSVLGAKRGSAGNAGQVNINVTDNARILVGDATHKAEGSSAIFAQRVVGGGGKDNIYLDLSNAAAAAHNGLEFNPHDDGMVGAVKGIISMGTNMLEYGLTEVKNYLNKGVTIAQDAVFGVDTECRIVNSSCSEEQNIVGGGGDSRITYQVDKSTADYAGIKINTTANFGSAGVTDANAEAMKSERIGQSIVDGDNSESSLVQSIGGGGGKLTAVVQQVVVADAATPTPVIQKVSAAASKSTTPSTPGSIIYAKLGADQSTNAHGGSIDYTYTGDTSVKGDHSIGTLMQSIGGGGGELRSVGVAQLDVSFGGVNGTQGNGGNITLNRDGAVYTDGVAGHGLVLQSIGGGGGAVFSDTTQSQVTVHLNTDNRGNGGDINLTQTGNIVVKGERATGLIVQSLGGGGGLIDDWFTSSAGGAGSSGDINITLNSSVAATGNQGVGVLAQSSARDGQGNITIRVAADQLIWGGKNGVGIHLSGGSNNRIINLGSITTEEGLTGTSIFSDGILPASAVNVAPDLLAKPAVSAGMTIDNYGSIIGQLNLTSGKNTFINHQQAQFLSGPQINLGGPDSLMINDGALQPGGENLVQAIQLNGSFTQSAMGVTYGDLDLRDQSIDSLSVTGMATLAGNLNVSLLHPEDVRPGKYIKPVFSAAQGIVDQGLHLTTAPSVVINYKLITQQTAEAVQYNVDFAPEALGKHLSGIGQYFNRIQTAGGGDSSMDAVVTNLLYIPTMDGYSLSMTQMSPEFYAQQQVQLLNTSSLFANRMADCQQPGRSNKPAAFYDSCAWLHIEQESSNARKHDGVQNLERSLNRFSAGFVKYFDTNWGVGMGLGADESQMNGYDHQWTDAGKARHLGFSLNHSNGATHYAVSAAVTAAKDITQRTGQVIDPFVAETVRDSEAYTLATSWSHIYANDIGYIRPQLVAGYTRLKADKTQEKGAGALNLQLTDYAEDHTWVQPEVELGWDVVKIGQGKLRLKYSLGAQYYVDGKTTSVEAGFEDTPAEAQPMLIPIELGHPNVHSKFGVEYISDSGVVVLIEAKQSRADNTRASGAEMQLQVPF